MSKVGFVGLGAMGSRIAGRLLDAGHELYGNNRSKEKAQELIERGMHWCDSPREVAEAAEVTFSMVTDDAALEAITSGPEGILAGLGEGKLYVDMSTVSPKASRAVAEQAVAKGAQMLDAPVSGSIPQAEGGTLAIFAGGEERAFAQAKPLLEELGEAVTHVGSSGQGLVIKLAVNISLAVQPLAFSEGLLLAERAGIDPKVAVAAMSNSSIGSPMLKARAPLMLDLPDEAWFDLAMMHKDIRLARAQARELDVPLPSASAADELLGRGEDLGYEHRDLAAIYEVLEKTSA